jgi:pimeloyl-ACP methyl ester carboxylesterase
MTKAHLTSAAPGSAVERATPWDPAVRHRFVTSDGTALYVRDDGERQPGDPTVVLIHGWTLDHTSWDRVAEALPTAVGRQLRILRYDHRGHGGSAPAPGDTATIAQCADDLAEIIEAKVPDGPVLLVGHSMGAMALLALVEQHPRLVDERVGGIAMISTTSGGLWDLRFRLPRWMARIGLFVEKFVQLGLARSKRPVLLKHGALLRPGLRWLLFGSRPRRADIAATAEQVARCHPANFARFRWSLHAHERREALTGLRDKPAVVLAGGLDRLTELSHARVVAAGLPDAEFAIFPKAGHMLPVERAEDVAAHIARLVPLAGEKTRPGRHAAG